MTIQIAAMNARAVAMAGARAPSASAGAWIRVLRGPVPAAAMASGSAFLGGVPSERLCIRMERALAQSLPGADALARAVLAVLDGPASDPAPSDDDAAGADAAVIRGALACVAAYAEQIDPDPAVGLRRVIEEMREAKPYRGGDVLMAGAREAWAKVRPDLAGRLPEWQARALAEAPELCGKAVSGALSRDWRTDPEICLSVGLCCPSTGVPALAAARAWRGLGNRITWRPHLMPDGFAAAPTARGTGVVPQGAGSEVIEEMVAGLGEEAWDAAGPEASGRLQMSSDGRWERAHARMASSSPGDLAAAAMGLVRGASALLFLSGDPDAPGDPVPAVDCALVTQWGTERLRLEAGASN